MRSPDRVLTIVDAEKAREWTGRENMQLLADNLAWRIDMLSKAMLIAAALKEEVDRGEVDRVYMRDQLAMLHQAARFGPDPDGTPPMAWTEMDPDSSRAERFATTYNRSTGEYQVRLGDRFGPVYLRSDELQYLYLRIDRALKAR